MSTEEEFARWLRRPEKTFLENLQFALKAWQSAEFTWSSKYETVLLWLVKIGKVHLEATDNNVTFPAAELRELLQLRTQPSLISQQTKSAFVAMWLQLTDTWLTQKQISTRVLPELLYNLISYDLLQDFYRTDYKAQSQVYAKLLRLYELYLQQFKATKDSEFHSGKESTFFAAIMSSLRDSAKRASDQMEFERCYSANTLQPLVQVMLLLRTHNLCFFEELLSLERQLCEQQTDIWLQRCVMQSPLHVRLLKLECAIVNRRGIDIFLQTLLKSNFMEMQHTQQPKLMLTVAAYTLEILRRHNIGLNFKMGDSGVTALAYLGAQIFPLVKKHKQHHLREVLMLLCAALRLNPLILEQHIFEVTTWVIVAPKNVASEDQLLFEEYLLLLIDMFRRLSRAEKFVSNLLKSLNEWLRHNHLTPGNSKGSKRQAVNAAYDGTPMKKSKGASDAPNSEADTEFATYLQIIFKDCYKPTEGLKNNTIVAKTVKQSFAALDTSWPSATVGVAFSRVITGLVSKPSLVIWKTLLYSLKEILNSFEAQPNLSHNELFQLDLHAALLCQYFGGARLAEQYENYNTRVLEQRQMTAEVLGTFGRWLLKCKYQQRTMNAFLECCYYAASFEMLLAYYLPDGLIDDSLNGDLVVRNLHGYLTTSEWTFVHQNILNFGSATCKYLFERLQLQRRQAELLLATATNHTTSVPIAIELSLEKTLNKHVGSDVAQLNLLLEHAHNAKWCLTHLKREEKLQVAKALHKHPAVLVSKCTDNLELVEFLVLCIYEHLCSAFITVTGKDSLMSSLHGHFAALYHCDDAETLKTQMELLVHAINAREDDLTLKQIPEETTKQALQTLALLPLAHLRSETKCKLFALHLACYRDLKAAHAMDLATETFNLLTDLLHFGQKVPIFNYFSIKSILQLLPVDSCYEFYKLIFARIKMQDKNSDRFLLSLIALLKEAQDAGQLSDDQLRLVLIAIETLSGQSGPSATRMRQQLEQVLHIYGDYVQQHFAKTQGENAKKDKKFVEKTLAGFAPYIKMIIGKEVKVDEKATHVNEHFRRICKVYIGHSMDYRKPHATNLLQVALNHRQQLHLDQDEIEFVLSGYWRQLNAVLNTAAPTALTAKSTETAVKIIIGHKTNEDLLLTLKDIAENVAAGDVKSFLNATRLLALIAKFPTSTIKGAIFNEQFKQITYDIILRLAKDERQQYTDMEQVLSILACQHAIVENKMIPLSMDTLDSILTFLMDINIKKFQLSDINVPNFHALHLAMIELTTELIKKRHVLLMDRVPQFMHIFKDLLQAVVWYKSERQKEAPLTPTELDDLAELALKLEALMHIIATHGVNVKRVAPFVLTFVIQLMVTNKRPTTLYPKIKTHIESICYDLVGICDHRVGSFILRCSNEAARQVYELLVKDHKKYHKFKGKV